MYPKYFCTNIFLDFRFTTKNKHMHEHAACVIALYLYTSDSDKNCLKKEKIYLNLISSREKMNKTPVIILQSTKRRTEHLESDVDGAQVEWQRVVRSSHVVVVQASQMSQREC